MADPRTKARRDAPGAGPTGATMAVADVPDRAKLPPALVPGLRAIELGSGDEPRLQKFFEANAEYFLAVQGEPARACEAREEIGSRPPADWTCGRNRLIGYVDDRDALAAVAHIACDLLAAGVWHIGLFIVATARHGTGDAQGLYQGLQGWAASGGADWLRLGVVKGHARAERFWTALGFTEVCERHDVVIGTRAQTIRVMVKPLANASVDAYLRRVPRDRPASAARG